MVVSFNAGLARRFGNDFGFEERGQDVTPQWNGQGSPAMRGLSDVFAQGEQDPGRVMLAALGIAAGMAMRAPQFGQPNGGGEASLQPASFPGMGGGDAPTPAAPGRDLRSRPFTRSQRRKTRRAQRMRRSQQKRRTTQTRQAQRRRTAQTTRARRTAPVNGEARRSLAYARQRAQELGLRITSTTGGRHAAHSYHYQGRAIDVAGSPARMAQFYREMSQLRPTELFYDPIGGMKHGRNIGAIGGHSNHVHVAF